MLALLTRVRAARVATGEISAARLYDVRAFKCVLAELGYLRTLTRRKTGGTIVTSMPQLVRGLARLHPAWRMTGDKFADRDRHQQAVRRRLRDLDAMGLLRWRIGVDVDGEDARTELELRPAPDVTADELAAAQAQLQRWQARYGAALNTGSSTGIRNAAGHGRPLSASERQRRGVARTRARRDRSRPSPTISAPRFAASATPKNNGSLRSNEPRSTTACGPRTGVRAREHERSTAWLTRARATDSANDRAALDARAETASPRTGGSGCAGGSEGALAASVEGLAARVAEREQVLGVIASQARCRALEVMTWSADRGWPVARLREAWVVWRYGAWCAAEQGSGAAGALEVDAVARLRRAVARYERYAAAAPAPFPDGGLAALAQIGVVAGERDARPRTLHYAIRQLDQLSRAMRAAATAHDPRSRDRAAARARRRRSSTSAPLAFRRSPWPAWVAVDEHGDPLLRDGELVTNDRAGLGAPPPHDPHYRAVLRDAQLLAGLWPHVDVDGRTTMVDGRSRYDLETSERRAVTGPYAPPAGAPRIDRDVAEEERAVRRVAEQLSRVVDDGH